jgi:hypothetical protein
MGIFVGTTWREPLIVQESPSRGFTVGAGKTEAGAFRWEDDGG